jgi:hypothetical protein
MVSYLYVRFGLYRGFLRGFIIKSLIALIREAKKWDAAIADAKLMPYKTAFGHQLLEGLANAAHATLQITASPASFMSL